MVDSYEELKLSIGREAAAKRGKERYKRVGV